MLYRERQWVPWYWWLLGALAVGLTSAQLMLNRNIWWFIVPAIVLGLATVWMMLTLSSTVLTVTEDEAGTRWLNTNDAQLPGDVVSRSTEVPPSAKRNAMGRQLDPAAYVVSHGWVPQMIMLVLDDPEDDTPYWLIGSKHPRKLLDTFLRR